MFKSESVWSLVAITLIANHIPIPCVESKAQLCRPPPKWTANNGTDPMSEAKGNVTLVTLVNSSYRFGLKQASSLENMLKFLRKSGLKDINFVIINSKDTDAKKTFKELLLKVSFDVYQETEDEEVWSALDGGKDDMFIYDRCGLLTYYIPFPLSIVHAQQPILQAALLSTYFDNPCGDSCDRSDTKSTSISTSPSTNAIDDTTVTPRPLDLSATTLNLTFDRPLSQDINDTNDNKTVDKLFVLKEEKLLEFQTDSPILMEECSGSGSGDDSSDDSNQVNVLITDPNFNDTNAETNSTNQKEDDDWKVLEFFKPNDNRTDKDVFEEIYNKSIAELDLLNNTIKTNGLPIEMTTTKESLIVSNESLTTSGPQLSITIPKRNGFSFFNSHTKCDTFNASMCAEWSTDRLLRVRLCCLSDIMADDDSGFGCGHFPEKGKCNRMLPLIKCCLKDFSQLLDNYYQSIKDNPRPSRQRFRDQPPARN